MHARHATSPAAAAAVLAAWTNESESINDKKRSLAGTASLSHQCGLVVKPAVIQPTPAALTD